jgi:glycosyltransferase involved in cell wall biosynthesis
MTDEKAILLLGRRDEPTDGVADYCEKLRGAGGPRGLSFQIVTMHWAEKGWRNALAELREAAPAWRDRWVLLQYTTLAWSRRGFPLRAPRILHVLRQCGARPGVVFHDFSPLPGPGIVGSVREYCHLLALRQLYAGSDLAIFTVSLDKISWLPAHREKESFIPVGANCAESFTVSHDGFHDIKTVAVYSITGGDRTSTEVTDLGTALKRACISAGPIRLLLFGRGSREAEPAIRSELAGLDIEIKSLGLLSPAEVTRALSGADVLLFVRGQISTRRGSAIAGIANGLPIVCYSGSETCWPITEAGICAAPLGNCEALATALENVLSDDALRTKLAGRSREAYKKYFSWAAIAERFEEELHSKDKALAASKGAESNAIVQI